VLQSGKFIHCIKYLIVNKLDVMAGRRGEIKFRACFSVQLEQFLASYDPALKQKRANKTTKGPARRAGGN
jgi:hypothetical protein